jgi:hypothetical protein
LPGVIGAVWVGGWAVPAGFVCVVLWVAIAIVRSTLRR